MPFLRSSLARLVDARDDEVGPALLAGLYFFFLLASYFVLRPIRDTMGVAAGGARLPVLFVGTLVATLVCQPFFAAVVARFPARRFIPMTYQFFALNLLGFWILIRNIGGAGASVGDDVWIGRIFFVWTSVFNLFVVSVFWCFMADTFNSEQAKRLFGFIGVGGTLGGLVGAAATATLVGRIGTANLLLVSFVLLEIATIIVLRFPRTHMKAVGSGPEPSSAPPHDDKTGLGGGLWTGITHFFQSPYLLGIGGFLILYTMGSTILYFQQADIIGARFADPTARTRVLAQMEFASQSITVLTQIFLTGRIIKTIGLAATLAVMPALSVVGFILVGLGGLGLVPAFAVFVGFSVIRRGTNFALTNPSMEVLFTVLPREDKYKAKSFIETFVYRTGDQIAAWSYAGLVALGLSHTAIAWPAAVLAIAFLAIGVWLGRRHAELAAKPAA